MIRSSDIINLISPGLGVCVYRDLIYRLPQLCMLPCSTDLIPHYTWSLVYCLYVSLIQVNQLTSYQFNVLNKSLFISTMCPVPFMQLLPSSGWKMKGPLRLGIWPDLSKIGKILLQTEQF